ncbi:glycosyltransferase [Paraglaciecola sp. 2405UD69-4]|uniref:glycosyltransferase n=1 Tax=Paraglaciecola sp. 2405UD69-4 TaxID=3391836 RepID=UPI0039C93AAF
MIKNNHKNVLFVPDYSEANPYQKMLADELLEHHAEVKYDKFYPSIFPLFTIWKKHKNIDVIHLHWVVDLISIIAWSKNPLIFKIKCFLLRLDCLLVRALGVKLLWTIHNKFAHQQLERTKETQVRRALVKGVNQIIVHSENALDTLCEHYQYDFRYKSTVVFHGNYNGVYPAPSATRDQLLKHSNLNAENKIIAYIGMIRPYKGVDKLISAFMSASIDKASLLIAGAPLDKEYGNKLVSKAANNPNITFDLQFLEDQSLIDYLKVTDVICLPFSDTLTSGSVILAMTMGKALILPETARVFGCVPNEGVVYFNTSSELTEILINIDKLDVIKMGLINKNKANSMTWSEAANLTNALYNT